MIAIRMSYQAGRLEPAGWQPLDWRSIEWPPSTSRFLNGLVGAFHRRVGRVTPAQLRRIVGDLSSPPHFLVPAGAALSGPPTASHRAIRFFDARLETSPPDDLVWWWPEAGLDARDRGALETLLLAMNTFDRQEVWCQARLLADHELAVLPPFPPHTGEAPRPGGRHPQTGRFPPHTWEAPPANALPIIEGTSSPPMPFTDLEVRLAGPHPVRVLTEKGSTHDWLERWMTRAASSPGPQAADPDSGSSTTTFPVPQTRVTVARYRLASGIAPGLELALPFGERVRRALIYHRSRAGHSRAITGKEPDGTPLAGHGHAHFLPTDEDGDGLLDHVTVYAPDGYDPADLEALFRLRSLVAGGDGAVVRLELEAVGDAASMRAEPLFARARRWRSFTSYSLPRFASRGSGKSARPRDLPEAQLRRELTSRGLPAPVAIQPLEGIQAGERWLPWIHFSGRRANGTAGHGLTGFELEFAEPAEGPLALGFGCHFGLGQFLPARSDAFF